MKSFVDTRYQRDIKVRLLVMLTNLIVKYIVLKYRQIFKTHIVSCIVFKYRGMR